MFLFLFSFSIVRSSSLDNDSALAALTRSEVRVVSFDLDNTIWKTGVTIQAANDAVADFLASKDIRQPLRVEKLMGQLFKGNKSRYCPLEKENAKAPVCLTLLRKEATCKLLEEYNDYSIEDAKELAEEVFEVWARARHEAIPKNMASSVERCLQEIAAITTSDGKPVLIGAITDGNSDPSRIESLSPFFDFCINAESVGVSKPDKRVYLKGVATALCHPSLNDIGLPSTSEVSDDEIEESLGPYWVHIGDDFAKDIVAAKALNMRTIWMRELVLDTIQAKEKKEDNTTSIGNLEDFVKRVSDSKVLKMEIGADDYLANGLQQEFADAVVDQFTDISNVLTQWHTEAQMALGDRAESERDLEAPAATAAAGHLEPRDRSPDQAKASKFCMFCGESIPKVAKFCPECGERQSV